MIEYRTRMTLIKQIKNEFLSVPIRQIRAINVPLILVAIILGIFSCKKDPTQPLAMDKSYFPLVTGKYIIYDVDSVGYNSFDNSNKTSIYQIKEEVDSPYIDNTGNQA